jgi:chromosome segregation ATPase
MNSELDDDYIDAEAGRRSRENIITSIENAIGLAEQRAVAAETECARLAEENARLREQDAKAYEAMQNLHAAVVRLDERSRKAEAERDAAIAKQEETFQHLCNAEGDLAFCRHLLDKAETHAARWKRLAKHLRVEQRDTAKAFDSLSEHYRWAAMARDELRRLLDRHVARFGPAPTTEDK